MRVVSSDGTRNFPYDDCAFILRTMFVEDNTHYSVNSIYCGKEYEMASYSKGEIAYNIMQELMRVKQFIEGVDDDGNPYIDEITYIKFPTEEEYEEDC